MQPAELRRLKGLCICARQTPEQLPRLQDLSVYSWLECRPDDLYSPTQFALRDLGELMPRSLLEYLGFWRHQLPAWEALDNGFHSLAWYRITARPMQVGAHRLHPGVALLVAVLDAVLALCRLAWHKSAAQSMQIGLPNMWLVSSAQEPHRNLKC